MKIKPVFFSFQISFKYKSLVIQLAVGLLAGSLLSLISHFLPKVL
jgi:hypothetical protein